MLKKFLLSTVLALGCSQYCVTMDQSTAGDIATEDTTICFEEATLRRLFDKNGLTDFVAKTVIIEELKAYACAKAPIAQTAYQINLIMNRALLTYSKNTPVSVASISYRGIDIPSEAIEGMPEVKEFLSKIRESTRAALLKTIASALTTAMDQILEGKQIKIELHKLQKPLND